MPDTIRKQILTAIATKLDEVAYGMGQVTAYQPSALDMAQWKYPACFVWVQDDAAASGDAPDTAIQLEFWKTTIAVEVWGKGDVEEYLGQVHKAMAVDCTWGALALDTWRKGSDSYEFDPTHQVTGIRILFTLHFRHKSGDPYSLV